MQALQRPRRVAKLAVIVVFDDPRAGLGCPLQERETAHQAHRHAERKLIGGRDVRQARVRCLPRCRGDVEALTVHADGNDPGARLRERAARARIPGFFEPDAIARVEQHTADHLQSTLRARDDEHLIGDAGRAAGCLHVFGNGLPQIDAAG